ncbi:MAG TPA: hypothetical protein VMR80_10525 [Candidatus Acidoferrum sp.]|nr:hypothetical protein [Candidatus Acidoferrum sp.]
MANLGQLIEQSIRELQNRPPAPAPAVKPEPKDQDVIDRMIAAALPQSRRDHAAREKAIAQAKKQQEADARRALLNGFNGEFDYEQADPKFL